MIAGLKSFSTALQGWIINNFKELAKQNPQSPLPGEARDALGISEEELKVLLCDNQATDSDNAM